MSEETTTLRRSKRVPNIKKKFTPLYNTENKKNFPRVPKKLPTWIPLFFDFVSNIQQESYEEQFKIFQQYWERFSETYPTKTKTTKTKTTTTKNKKQIQDEKTAKTSNKNNSEKQQQCTTPQEIYTTNTNVDENISEKNQSIDTNVIVIHKSTATQKKMEADVLYTEFLNDVSDVIPYQQAHHTVENLYTITIDLLTSNSPTIA